MLSVNGAGRVLLEETSLESDIRPGQAAPTTMSPPRSVLLTGATGFIGAHIVDTLRRYGIGTIFCLVRAPNADAGRERVLSSLDRYGLRRGDDAEAIVGVDGDLGAPGFGLDPGAFRELAARVDAVIHNGAWVHLAHGYETLRPTNVWGTREALRLSVARGTKRFCHVSGMSVFLGTSVMNEDAPPPATDERHGGYFDSKWVAERIVWEGLDRGMPGCIVRLGWISGDSREGRIGHADAMTMFIRACIRLGMAPRLPSGRIDCTPVDVAAEVIVDAALHGLPAARACNLWATHSIAEGELWQRLRRQGARIVMVSPAEWLDALGRRLPMLVPVGERVVSGADLPPIDDAVARAVAGRAVERMPTVDHLLSVYARAWLRSGRGTSALREQSEDSRAP
jgi:thioester reductase-like protein